jgi:hypothetical protein
LRDLVSLWHGLLAHLRAAEALFDPFSLRRLSYR